MKLAVFGGSGLTGAAVIELALQQGHTVRALVRPGSELPVSLNPTEVVRGNALDPRAVADTVAGTDAVISSLGGFRGPDSMEGGTENILAAMRQGGQRRLVVVQGFHLRFTGDPRNPARRIVTLYLGARCRPILTHSAALGEILTRTHDIDWTLVRVPPITARLATGRARRGRFPLGPFSSVTVGDLASTVLELVATSDAVHDAPMLMTPRRA